MVTTEKQFRIHIFGASGSGTSALGKALSEKLGIPNFDFDDYFWIPTDPPFRQQRDCETKFKMIMEDTKDMESFIISGHYAISYEPLDSKLTLAIFLYVPTEIRQKRIHERDIDWFGDRILKGGDMYEEHEAFIKWAGNYDMNNDTGRNIVKHRKRIELLKCPVIKIEGDIPIEEVMGIVIKAIRK